jgi:hypothetical protein
MNLVLCIAISLGLAFGYMLGLTYPLSFHSDFGPVHQSVRFDGRDVPALMDKGWGKQTANGIPMISKRASVLLGAEAAKGDVELIVEGHVPAQTSGRTLVVNVNDRIIGRWMLISSGDTVKRAFRIPRDIFNRTPELRVDFESTGGKRLNWSLVAIEVQDMHRRPDAVGHVDVCSADRITGWATVGPIPSVVVVRVDGVEAAGSLVNVDRSDLVDHGYPRDAGYELVLDKKPAPGSTIDVSFPDGRPLIGSPCRII